MKKDEKTVERPKCKRIGQVIGDDIEFEEIHNAEESLNVELVIEDFAERTGEFGPYVIMKVRNIEGDGFYGVSCGGAVVKEKLLKVKEKNGFPVMATLVKKKKYYNLI